MSNNLFICEICGGVCPETCPKCPDRGNGRGCTVQVIKDHLRSCTQNAEVTACHDHYRRHIATLRRSKTPGAAVMAVQIINLISYIRWEISNAKRQQQAPA